MYCGKRNITSLFTHALKFWHLHEFIFTALEGILFPAWSSIFPSISSSAFVVLSCFWDIPHLNIFKQLTQKVPSWRKSYFCYDESSESVIHSKNALWDNRIRLTSGSHPFFMWHQNKSWFLNTSTENADNLICNTFTTNSALGGRQENAPLSAVLSRQILRFF